MSQDQLIMALAFNDNYIIYRHMDTQCSIGSAQTYFTSPDYLVFQFWVCDSFFGPDTINPTELKVYHCAKFLGVVGYTPLGFPCTQPIAAINYSNPALPFVVTAFPAL